MSRQATESTLSKVNRLIGVNESYKAPEKIMRAISDAGTARELFFKFLPEFGYDLSYEWFNEYFEDEHADRKNKKQDFTPVSVSKLISEMQGEASRYGVIYEPAAGTGSTVIAHWFKESRKHRYPWDYSPENYLYLCEELSGKTIPFLLFNLLIRGMNALVIHGNTLTREAKEVYHCCNESGAFMSFSKLRKLPHTGQVEKLCGIRFVETEKNADGEKITNTF
ncbi:MAG: SAM-dependent methyltransferase [Lachnospiraceae bacterium]|nr:SAM-dependent methyltransferase [Lachnospiraceae bacterium]